ncbi:MAG: DUF983 domain-containing protein [Flavobacteriales bacterium]|nr:DUF983 domain-containing protein [Flavobacteriales bacterium]
MIGKGNKLYSMLFLKCPKCHETDLFEQKNPYKVKGFFDMPYKCVNCGQKSDIEPGFFYGAMYVSYGISVAWLIAVFVAILVLYPAFSIEFYLVTAIGSLIGLSPYFFRLSRAIWVNFFVHYDKNFSKSPLN